METIISMVNDIISSNKVATLVCGIHTIKVSGNGNSLTVFSDDETDLVKTLNSTFKVSFLPLSSNYSLHTYLVR